MFQGSKSILTLFLGRKVDEKFNIFHPPLVAGEEALYIFMFRDKVFMRIQ